jgi:hypothetical protein
LCFPQRRQRQSQPGGWIQLVVGGVISNGQEEGEDSSLHIRGGSSYWRTHCVFWLGILLCMCFLSTYEVATRQFHHCIVELKTQLQQGSLCLGDNMTRDWKA